MWFRLKRSRGGQRRPGHWAQLKFACRSVGRTAHRGWGYSVTGVFFEEVPFKALGRKDITS